MGLGEMAVAGRQRQLAAPNVPVDPMESILPIYRGKKTAKEGEGGQALETQGTGAPAGAQGERGGKAREGRDRRARQEPGGPRGTEGGGTKRQGTGAPVVAATAIF